MGLKSNILNTTILGIILLVVLFQSYAAILPTTQAAGNSLNDTNQCSRAGCFYNESRTNDCSTANTTPSDTTSCATGTVPLGSLFSGTGVLFIVIMAALLILVVRAFLPGGKK